MVKDTEKLERSDIEAAKKCIAEHNQKLVKKAKSGKSEMKAKGE